MTFSVGDLRPYDVRKISRGAARKVRYLETRSGCWFCGASDGSASNEHVVGRWLEKRFDAETLRFHPHRANLMGRGEMRGPMPSSAMTLGGVCVRCNNGWMSHLEATAKRVLTGPARSIPAQEARLLAQWAEKTAVVLNLSQTFPLAWNRDDRGSVVDGPSSRSRVSLFRVADSDVNFVQGDFITATAPSGWPTSTKVAALQLVHVSRVCIGRIVVVTMHVPWQAQPLRNCRMPGQEIWSGSKAHPFDAETLPVLESWRDGIVAFEIGESAFWRTPSLHDIYRPVDWA